MSKSTEAEGWKQPIQKKLTARQMSQYFAKQGETIDVETLERIFSQVSRKKMSVLDVTATLIAKQKRLR